MHNYDELGNDVTLKIYHKEIKLKRKLEKLEKNKHLTFPLIENMPTPLLLITNANKC